MNCPACSGKKSEPYAGYTTLYKCQNCNALYGSCFLGTSHTLVKPHFVSEERQAELNKLTEEAGWDGSIYFDFMCCGSKGQTRRHGWYDPKTGCMTQVG